MRRTVLAVAGAAVLLGGVVGVTTLAQAAGRSAAPAPNTPAAVPRPSTTRPGPVAVPANPPLARPSTTRPAPAAVPANPPLATPSTTRPAPSVSPAK